MNAYLRLGFLLIAVVGLNEATYATTDDLIECGRQALSVATLTSDQAVKLCVNGGTPKSVECAHRAIVDLKFTAEQAVELCANKALRLENMVKFVQ